jgi:hypothetical protein
MVYSHKTGAPSSGGSPETDLAPILAIHPWQTECGEDEVNLEIPFHSVLRLLELVNSERMSSPKATEEAERLLVVREPPRVRGQTIGAVWKLVNIQTVGDRLHKRASHPGCDAEVLDRKDRIIISFVKRMMCAHDDESRS